MVRRVGKEKDEGSRVARKDLLEAILGNMTFRPGANLTCSNSGKHQSSDVRISNRRRKSRWKARHLKACTAARESDLRPRIQRAEEGGRVCRFPRLGARGRRKDSERAYPGRKCASDIETWTTGLPPTMPQSHPHPHKYEYTPSLSWSWRVRTGSPRLVGPMLCHPRTRIQRPRSRSNALRSAAQPECEWILRRTQRMAGERAGSA